MRGPSELLRDREATLLAVLSQVQVLCPEETDLAENNFPRGPRTFLYLEALLRSSLLTGTVLTIGHQTGVSLLDYGNGLTVFKTNRGLPINRLGYKQFYWTKGTLAGERRPTWANRHCAPFERCESELKCKNTKHFPPERSLEGLQPHSAEFSMLDPHVSKS